MSAGQHNSAHAYHGARSSRALRKLSKLGRAISLTRLNELLGEKKTKPDGEAKKS